MKPSTAVLLGILVVIVLGGIFYLFVNKAGQTSETASTTPTTVSTNGGTSAGGDVGIGSNSQTTVTPAGLSFSVAPPYGLATNSQQIMATAVIPPCDQGFDYCIYRTQPPIPNSNYESAGIAIKQRTDLQSQNACLTAAPAGYTGLKSTTSQQSGYATSVFSPVGGGAAGSTATGAVYRLWYGTTCYQFETRVAKAQYANYPAGTKAEFTAALEGTVKAELQNILAGMTIKGGTHVSFPSA